MLLHIAEAQRAARSFIRAPNGSAAGTCHSRNFSGVCNAGGGLVCAGGSMLSFCFSTQPDTAHCRGTCLLRGTPNRTHTQCSRTRMSLNTWLRPRKRRVVFKVSSISSLAWPVPHLPSAKEGGSWGSEHRCRFSPGQLRSAWDRAWDCVSLADPGGCAAEILRGFQSEIKIEFRKSACRRRATRFWVTSPSTSPSRLCRLGEAEEKQSDSSAATRSEFESLVSPHRLSEKLGLPEHPQSPSYSQSLLLQSIWIHLPCKRRVSYSGKVLNS